MNQLYQSLTDEQHGSNYRALCLNLAAFGRSALLPLKSIIEKMRFTGRYFIRLPKARPQAIAINEAPLMAPIGNLFTLSIRGEKFTVEKVHENTFELFQNSAKASAVIDGDTLIHLITGKEKITNLKFTHNYGYKNL